MSYKLQQVGRKSLNTALNIYHSPYVTAQTGPTTASRVIQEGDQVKWQTLDSVNSHKSFTFTLNEYGIIIPDDGFTYFLTAELDHVDVQSEGSFMFQFFDASTSTAMGFSGYRFGPLNRQLGQYTGDSIDLISDDGARVVLQGPKTLNLKFTLVKGTAPEVVGGVGTWDAISRARMLVWRI